MSAKSNNLEPALSTKKLQISSTYKLCCVSSLAMEAGIYIIYIVVSKGPYCPGNGHIYMDTNMIT